MNKKVEIRYWGGLWRRFEENKVRSFSTFSDALKNEGCYEEGELWCSDDLLRQIGNNK